MHLANGAVTPMCAVYGMGLAAAGIAAGAIAARKHKLTSPYQLAAATAIVFAAQAFNVPVTAHASGHVVGAFLLARCFGAGWAALAMSAVLTVQSVLLGDGGMAALGLNIFNMAVMPALIIYPVWRRLAGTTRLSIAGGAWASVMIAALAASVELKQPSWSLTATMLGLHALIGLLEAIGTLAALALMNRLSPIPLVGAALAILAAASFGSSPWPDGLEYSLQLNGLAALIGAVDEQPMIFGFAGCAVVILLVLAVARLIQLRGAHVAAN